MADKFNLDGFSVSESNVCTADGGFVGVSGGESVNMSVDGAIDPSNAFVFINNAASARTLTLAGGSIPGQTIYMKALGTQSSTVTPANYRDGTTITFDAGNEWRSLIWDGGSWCDAGGTATVS